MIDSKPNRPTYEELLQQLKEGQQERQELRQQVRRLEAQLAGGPSSSPPSQVPSPVGGARRRMTAAYESPVSPGFHISNRTRRNSDVVAIAPSHISGDAKAGAVDARGAEDRADFDHGRLRQLSAEQLDGLPYGVIVVDRSGDVVEFNDTESRLVGLDKERVVGKNFFRDIAPCTRIKSFLGRFEQFVARDNGFGVETFDFVFRFQKSTQTVTVYITAGRQRGTYNIAMLRRLIARH